MRAKQKMGIILIFIMLIQPLSAQDSNTKHHINMNLGLGYSYYLTSLEMKIYITGHLF